MACQVTFDGGEQHRPSESGLDGLLDVGDVHRDFRFFEHLRDQNGDAAATWSWWPGCRTQRTRRGNALELLSQLLQPRGYLWVRQGSNQSD